ncbi:MAG TPA: PilZ domain-containing protein [Xanthobacteraceae bacterium]|nr:PilZ domain-containing protein [Xanthobacteraceae bacterium]
MDDRRLKPRNRTFLQGRVFYNNRRQSADCIIRELTEEGARLSFTDPVGLPHAFELNIPNRDQTLRVETIWNHGIEVGVRFDKPVSHSEPHEPAAEQSLAERIEKLEREVASLKRRILDYEQKNG